jgi:hypothetical protein
VPIWFFRSNAKIAQVIENDDARAISAVTHGE